MLLTLHGDSVAATLTDERGRFAVTASEPGEYLLHAAALGFEPTTAGRVFVRGSGSTQEIRMLRSRGYCTPTVYVDNVRIASSDLYLLEAMAPPATLYAAEVYRSGVEALLQYGGGMGGCGIIVLWTRAG